MSGRDSANGGGAIAELPILTTKRIVADARLVVVLLLVGIYFFFPKLVGLGDALGKLDEADPIWIVIAIGFNVARLRDLHRPVQSGRRRRRAAAQLDETYEINMAGVAATLLFSAGGAGGVALTYWALRKAGMARPRRRPPDGRLHHPPLRLLSDRPDRLRRSCCGPAWSTARTRSS